MLNLRQMKSPLAIAFCVVLLANGVAGADPLGVGAEAPELDCERWIPDQAESLATYRGHKPVILYFFASW